MTVRRAAAGLVAALSLSFATAAQAEVLRIATYNVDLSRKGPGLLLRDIARGEDTQIAAVVQVIATVRPDVLALQGIDWDLDGMALAALRDALARAGVDYAHRFAAQPNTGLPSGHDMDGDGRRDEPEDAQGYGAFTGANGMALLSRLPIDTGGIRDFTSLLWADLLGAQLPIHADGTPFPSEAAQAAQRLSSVAHWAVPVRLPSGQSLTVLTFHATPPVFDGPEDRNGRRNADEILFWRAYLDGAFGPAPDKGFVIAGDANLDPHDSDGRRAAITSLLNDPRLQDPRPASPGAETAPAQGHSGPDALDTVDWEGIGRLRVDYVLPSRDLRVIDAGVYWPAPGTPGHDTALAASRHRLVWVDVETTP
jgi:endonuclease/exonuclease/phosphatase family metal-dependent hydrolase